MADKSYPPPPTRFPAPAGIQAKAGPRNVPPPPVKYPAPAGVQAKAAGLRAAPVQSAASAGGPGRLIQKMEEEGIGARLRRKSIGSSFKSERLREQFEVNDFEERPVYKEPKVRGRWDYKTRPSWFDVTWVSLSDDAMKDPAPYTCVKCGLTPIYRKKDVPKQDRSIDATIDHKKQWMKYVAQKGESDDYGYVTSDGAKEAYNALANLQIMCRSCNAKKNGEKNVFD